MIFFPGLHHPGDAHHFRFVCISINRLWTRRKPIGRKTLVLVDSGAFTVLDKHGHYPPSHSVEAYARRLYELHTRGVVRIMAAVAQDYMCEDRITAKTGLTVLEHQRLTIERYDALVAELRRLFGGPIPFHVMPVLQGQTQADYLRHLAMYGARITPGMWVGVGSVCKRQGDPAVIEGILRAIKRARPDLWLHGFGVKSIALAWVAIRRLLATADSMAWSFAAKKVAARLIGQLLREFGVQLMPAVARWVFEGRGITLPDANDWREAKRFRRRISAAPREPEQLRLDLAA
jgi:hypothetical protein